MFLSLFNINIDVADSMFQFDLYHSQLGRFASSFHSTTSILNLPKMHMAHVKAKNETLARTEQGPTACWHNRSAP
jgi:hypothetical protein